jgi:hypothetical protein
VRSNNLEIDVPTATEKSEFSESKIFIFTIYRGGIAVVWLGQRTKPSPNQSEYVAMKQFPKQGSQCDTSAIVEL